MILLDDLDKSSGWVNPKTRDRTQYADTKQRWRSRQQPPKHKEHQAMYVYSRDDQKPRDRAQDVGFQIAKLEADVNLQKQYAGNAVQARGRELVDELRDRARSLKMEVRIMTDYRMSHRNSIDMQVRGIKKLSDLVGKCEETADKIEKLIRTPGPHD